MYLADSAGRTQLVGPPLIRPEMGRADADGEADSDENTDSRLCKDHGVDAKGWVFGCVWKCLLGSVVTCHVWSQACDSCWYDSRKEQPLSHS